MNVMKSPTKVSLVAAAVASALGTSAYALPPSAWTSGMTVYYSGGGSAEANAVFSAVNGLLTNVDVYTDNSPTAKHPQSANYLAVSGTTNGTGGLPAGTNIGFIYKYNGGSFPNGALPFVGAGSNLVYPTLASLAGAAVISPAPSPITSTNPSYSYTGVNTNSNLPDWGITDEEVSLFNVLYNLNGSPIQNLTGINSKPAYIAPFGVAVTSNLFTKKKNFSKGEIASILQGTVSDWSQLNDDTGAPLAAGGVILLDRGSGSGTKASGNQFFLNYPGGNATGGALRPGSVSATAVIGNAASVNVYTSTTLVTNVTDFQDVKEASNASTVDDLVLANTKGLRAVAILGLEFPPLFEQNTAGVNDYSFAAIDGTYPDTQTGTTDNINATTRPATTKYTNIVNGTYEYWFQTAYNLRSGFTLSAFQNAVRNNLYSVNLSAAHTGSAFPTSAPGVLLDPLTTHATSAGNLSVTRKANSTSPPVFQAVVTPAVGDPL
jgi:hypothetical protein